GGAGGVSAVAALIGAVSRAGAATTVKPGDLPAEIARTREAIAALEGRIATRDARLDQLKGASKPVTPAQEKAYQDTLALLASKSDKAYVQSKLAEISDLNGRRDGAAALKSLGELADYYRSILPAPPKSTGYYESLGVRVALMKTVQDALAEFQKGSAPAPRPQTGVDRELTARRIEPLVSELEKLRAQAKGELASRDALERLLASLARARNMALADRRNGKDMLEFHKNMARLATVMDLAFTLNTITAAEKAITDMQTMLDQKLAAIQAAQQQAQQNLAASQANQAQLDAWRKEVDATVADDKQQQSDYADLEHQTRLASDNISGLRTDLQQMLATLNAADGGSSPDALTEYNRRLALLPTLVQWNTDGKPGDPNYASLKGYQDELSQIAGYTSKIADGLSKIGSAPVEFAGILVVAVPGVPDVSVSNPSAAQTLQILAARRAYWQDQLNTYQTDLTSYQHRMDPSFSGTETDDFGEVHPYSLPRRLTEAQGDLARYSAQAHDLAAQIDAAAAPIRAAVPGADLPTLTGLSLAAFQTAIESYPDKLSAVTVPADASSQNQYARIAMLQVGRLLPAAGHAVIEWSKADATVTAVQDAMTSPLPQAIAAKQGVVTAIQKVLADVDADVAYVNAGSHSDAANQALIDRKRALLESLQPALENAKQVLTNNAIPYQQQTIQSYDPHGDKYAKLFNSQVTLYTGTRDALNQTLPWSLISGGARKGDTSSALANIAASRKHYQDLMTGYDDAQGHHMGVQEHLDDLAH
ncbi:MAG: hypothetical protein KGL53_16370, partial [Elusimicrobia bacterium]|nr:hypothetical protein [Elusimicrobiota bacterium]